MSLSDLMRKGLNQFAPLLKTGFAPEFIDSIKKGYVLVPDRLIRREIEEAIGEKDGVELVTCEFGDDGIHLSILAHRLGTHIAFPMLVTITKVAINGTEQTLELDFRCGKPVGENLFGRLTVAVASAFLSQVLTEKITQTKLATSSHVHQEGTYVTIDLSSIPQIQLLKTRIPVLGNKCALDVVSIQGHEHVSGAIRLKGHLEVK